MKSIDDIWSSVLLDIKDCDSSNNKGYRYIKIVIDKFAKFGWRFRLKNKNVQTITDDFSQVSKLSERKSNLFETIDGKEYVN